MPGSRLQFTNILYENTNRAEVRRIAKPSFRLDVASDASQEAVDAVVAFFKKHEQDATLKMSPKSSRFIESGINVVFEDSVVVYLPKTATKSMVSRRLSTLLYDPVRPMLHQRVAVKEYVEKEPQTYMLAWSMGSGKSLGALLMTAAMKPAPPRRVLIICSNTLIGHWLKEIGRITQPQGETHFELVGYSEFRKMIATERNHFIRRYDVVIVDEAHYYRNLTPSMRGDVETLREAKRLILLTGTVLQNDKEERYGMLFLMGLDGNESLGGAEKELAKNNSVFYYNPSEHGSSFTQSAYPKIAVHVEKIAMAPTQTLEYLMSESKHTKIGTYTISTARCNSYNSLTRAISNTMTSGDMSPKFEKVIDNILSGKYPGPHVVYSHYRPKGVETVERELRSRKTKEGNAIRCVLMTGSTAARERDEMIASYNKKEIDVFFITDAAREGIDLHGTGTMHLIEPHENVHSERQTQSRVARHNSHVALPVGERKVNIVKYVSVFPKLRTCDKKALDSYFYKEYQLQSDGEFDIVDEVTQMIDKAGETVDEQYERTNVEKARELQPWIDMLHRVGFRKEAVGVDPVTKPSVSTVTPTSGTKKKVAKATSKTTLVPTAKMIEIVRNAKRKSMEALKVAKEPKLADSVTGALTGAKRKKQDEEEEEEEEKSGKKHKVEKSIPLSGRKRDVNKYLYG